MKNELDGAIGVLVKRVEDLSHETTDLKKTINSLCKAAGKQPMYTDADLVVGGFAGIPTLSPSQFYGKTPIVAAREYLDLRNEAVPQEEILEALRTGGFDFEAQGWAEPLRLRNLSISLGKNTAIFHRLPNNMIGLTKWYPNVKAKKVAPKLVQDADDVGEESTENAETTDETI
jgi:hypothetical protein